EIWHHHSRGWHPAGLNPRIPTRYPITSMHRTTDESGEAAAVDFASRIVPLCQAEIGSELLGAYLIGSLAHGGFRRRHSAVHIALVTEVGLSPQTLDRVRSH